MGNNDNNTEVGATAICASCGKPIIYVEIKIGRMGETTQRLWDHEGANKPRHIAAPAKQNDEG